MASPEELFAEFMPSMSEIYSEYVEGIANCSLQKYKLVIHERGSKAGEPLFTHVMAGIGVLTRLAAPEIMDLSDTEQRVLLSAFTVHDINKITDVDGAAFNKLAQVDNVATVLADLEIGRFFPEWKDYVEDITMLVRSHSGHYHTVGEIVIRTHDRTRLGLETVERLIPLIRAADIADLSQSLEERVHKSTLLKRLNSVSTQQYAFATHRITEQRGLLTNILHRVVQDHLSAQGAIPLLFYPDGIAYLVPRRGIAFERTAIEVGFATAVAEKLAGGYAEFIRSTNQGIKIGEQCLDQPQLLVWRAVLERIQTTRYTQRLENMKGAITQRLQTLSGINEQAKALLDEGTHHLSTDETVLRLGELMRTFYIFLADHFSGKGQLDPWSHLYELVDIPADVSGRWGPLDARYDRGYIVGNWLAEQGETLDTIWPKLLKEAQALCGSRETTGADPDLIAYARKNVCISLESAPEPDWGAGLRNYIKNRHKQCSLCGSEFPTQEWMAADVPNKQKVQQFSNRLSAGMTREPKRFVCTICRSQYLLDKLAYKTLDAGARCFVHFYPYSFFTPDYLESIRALWRREKAQGVDSLMTNVSASWRESEQYPRVALVRKTVMGMPVPEFSEAVGNIFSVPINTPGDNATERFLHAIQTALLWKLWLGCRVALTEAPEPPFGDDWRGDLFLDGIPASLRGLIPGNDLNWKEGQTLVERFRALRRLQSLVLDPKSRRNPLLLLARSLSLDALEPFWVMDRLILHKAESGNPGAATFLRREALPQLNTLIGKEDELSHIKRLAEIAWTGKLKGDSLKDTALAKPLDVALAALGGYDKAVETPEDLRAVTKKDVEEAIERVTEERYWGKTKIEAVSRFVDVLFDGLLKETYHDDVSALMVNKRRIRAAFLHYLAAQIGTKEEGKS